MSGTSLCRFALMAMALFIVGIAMIIYLISAVPLSWYAAIPEKCIECRIVVVASAAAQDDFL
jgi:hypothetical protein